MGIVVLLIIITAFTAGTVKQEAAIIFAGAILLLPWTYCLLMTVFLALLHKHRIKRASIRIIPRETSIGEYAQAEYFQNNSAFTGKILELPLILVRCRLLLETKDSRCISHIFNPADKIPFSFITENRGAYFSVNDEFIIFDSLGFFRFVYRIYPEQPFLSDLAASTARLLTGPRAADESPVVHARSGNSDLQPEFSFLKSDDFMDHRPYIPGDDPRKINWKLYSHGGGLLVRDSEYEPPPHSNILILIDTEYDPDLYKLEEARSQIDLLCENALAAALACKESGMDVLINYSREKQPEKITEKTLSENRNFTSDLAWPYTTPLTHESLLQLSVPNDNRGILVFALPRTQSETSLDRFIKKVSDNSGEKNKPRQIGILFLANPQKSNCISAAETCIAMYNRRSGIRAGIFGMGNMV